MNQTITADGDIDITIQRKVDEPGCRYLTPEKRFASKSSACVELTIERDLDCAPGLVRVVWNCNRGLGWARRKRSVPMSETEALAFAETKWSTCLKWLRNVEPQHRTGIPSSWWK